MNNYFTYIKNKRVGGKVHLTLTMRKHKMQIDT